MCEIKNTIDKDAIDKSNKSFNNKVMESINKIKVSEHYQSSESINEPGIK